MFTGDSALIERASQWFHDCISNHDTCDIQSSSYYPRRVVDLEPADLPSDHWRLLNTKDHRLMGGYVTLSHRWGVHNLKLNQDTKSKMLAGMPFFCDDRRLSGCLSRGTRTWLSILLGRLHL
jgi:hypothetical protein